MPKTRRNQLLLRAAIQADYLRNHDPRRPIETSGRLPPPDLEKPPAKREITDLR